jgi:hypothetical protein
MSNTTAAVWQWTPRLAGIAMSLFLAVFALDAFDGKSFVAALPGFVIHLVPAFLVLIAVAVAWRFPTVGGLAFAGLALFYAMRVHWRIAWIAVIGVPLLIIAALFVVSARYRVAR